jgi:Domain of unknown function (DUF1961)
MSNNKEKEEKTNNENKKEKKGKKVSKKIKILAVVVILGISASLIVFESLNGFVIPSSLPDTPLSSENDFKKISVLYSNPLANKSDIATWKMEGPGELTFNNSWMKMESPSEEFHHVFWCSQDFPEDFMAEWYIRNLQTDAGLLIVFFAAQGLNGEDLFSSSLSTRDGTFTDYTRGDMQNYHISYYANANDDPGRETTNLRKNKGFNLVQEGRKGVPITSKAIHRITLVKNQNQIVLFVDGREVINWIDKGTIDGDAHGKGKIGFRQMKWSCFEYQNITVWSI